MSTILILSSNPPDTEKLRWEEETRRIQDALRNRPRYSVQMRLWAQTNELDRLLLDSQPEIVHFCGHGKTDGLIFHDAEGCAQQVSVDALADLFKLVSQHVHCVVLNACYSQPQAEAIHQHIPCVIGMRHDIPDEQALNFTTGFYTGLADGRGYADAFEFGRNQIQRSDASYADYPELLLSPGWHANQSYTRDWQHLRDTSKLRWQAIPDTIGGSVRLPRTASHERIDKALQQHTAVCVLGDSGSGKSALTRRIAEKYTESTTVIWINAALFEIQDFEQFSRISLGLENPWQSLADSAVEQVVLVVLDGIDRLFKPESLANLTALLSSLQLDQTETPFRVLASCQPQRWEAIQQALLRHGITPWQTCTLDTLTLQELEPLSKPFSQLDRLLQRVDLRSLLFRPKILDLLACALKTASLPETRQWSGESDLIAWFWQAEIGDKPGVVKIVGF